MKFTKTQTKKTTDGNEYGNGWTSEDGHFYIEQILDSVECSTPSALSTQYRHVTESYEVFGPFGHDVEFMVKDYGSAPKAKKAAKEFCQNWQGPIEKNFSSN
mgnify:CR=1 FL=1